MEYSPKYEKVKGYYDRSLWNEEMVRNAVVKGWITEEEFAEIVGKKFIKIQNGGKIIKWQQQ